MHSYTLSITQQLLCSNSHNYQYLIFLSFTACTGGGGSLVVDPPTDDQIQCFTDEVTPRLSEFFFVCGDINLSSPNVSPIAVTSIAVLSSLGLSLQLTDFCGGGACFEFLSQIYFTCGYNGLSVGELLTILLWDESSIRQQIWDINSFTLYLQWCNHLYIHNYKYRS